MTRAADAPNGYKLEQFIFDVFQYAKNLVAFEIVREEEFSPLKNAPGAGKDCPETCRADLYRLHGKYLSRAGGQVVHQLATGPEVEISPLVSYAGEGLEEVVAAAAAGKEFKAPLLLG